MDDGFGSLEYVMDRYSKSWCWKVTGDGAVGMISRLVPRSWYGDGDDAVIIPDNPENVGHLKWMNENHPLEILSKVAWQRRAARAAPRRPDEPLPDLEEAEPGPQFLGELLGFQKQGLDFLIKSSGNALLADEMGLGKTVQTLAYLSTDGSEDSRRTARYFCVDLERRLCTSSHTTVRSPARARSSARL